MNSSWTVDHVADRETERAIPSREAAKRARTIERLFRCSRVLDKSAIEPWRARNGRPVGTAHSARLAYVALDGTRLTDLAERAEVTNPLAHDGAPRVRKLHARDEFLDARTRTVDESHARRERRRSR
jgi:hypothetical protein